MTEIEKVSIRFKIVMWLDKRSDVTPPVELSPVYNSWEDAVDELANMQAQISGIRGVIVRYVA